MTEQNADIQMFEARETVLAATKVRSLVWAAGTLVDHAGGHRLVDGKWVRGPYTGCGDIFDAAVSSPDGDVVVLYARLGTKGLVLQHDQVVREINRSYYWASAYEYPVALFNAPSGRLVLVHCPDSYRTLVLEDALTGERLTTANERVSSDFFHSRLAASPDGRYLVSAGWVWHPFDDIRVFDLHAALSDPARLDTDGIGLAAWGDESSAVFLPGGRLAMTLRKEEDEDGEPLPDSSELRLYDLARPEVPVSVVKTDRLGTLLGVDDRHVMALHGCPRLIDVTTGQERQRWASIVTGTQTSSILAGQAKQPLIAWDATCRRLAVSQGEDITLLEFASLEGA